VSSQEWKPFAGAAYLLAQPTIGILGTRTHHSRCPHLHDRSILQRHSNPVESLVYGRDPILQGIDLRARCRIKDADRRATA
jgi:hypothetical protein